jgi:hypothetical protein
VMLLIEWDNWDMELKALVRVSVYLNAMSNCSLCTLADVFVID